MLNLGWQRPSQRCWPGIQRPQEMHVQQNCTGINLSNLTSSPVFTFHHVLLVIGADSSCQQFLNQTMKRKIPTPTILWEHNTALGTKRFPRTSPSRWHKRSEPWMAKRIPKRCSDSTDTAKQILFLCPHNPFLHSSTLFPHSIQDLSIFNESHFSNTRIRKGGINSTP